MATGLPTLQATWAIAEDSKAEPLVRLEQKPLESDSQTVAAQLLLNALPWRLERSGPVDDATTRSCEVVLVFDQHPLQCKMLELRVTSSARHIELHIEGIRRSILGEDELSEVYFGTFRGTKKAPIDGGTASQCFDVAQEFTQASREHDVLKCIHKLRIKFVSLTGDKNVLDLTNFQCLYIATTATTRLIPTTAAATVSSTGPTSAMPSTADVMDMMAGMSLPGLQSQDPIQNPVQQAANPQMLLQIVQQMMEREVEAKITRALDARLAVLSQRLAFSEQMLLQVQHKSQTKHAQLETKLDTLQQQVVELRKQVGTKKQPKVDDNGDTTE